ncbi:MAG: hypothetical protein QJR08_00610 [Bacillota bacterium]|nr:hypothetical protein [Bacillota bacterium]
MAATIQSYRDPTTGEIRRVLWCKVRAESDEKVLAAVERAMGHPTMTVWDEVEEVGRADWDLENQVAERLVTLAKSVNHHSGLGDGVPPHTMLGIAELRATLDGLAAKAGAMPPEERALLDGYRKDLDEIAQAAGDGSHPVKTPRKDYGPREALLKRLVPREVPLPQEGEGGPAMTAKWRHETLPRTSVDGGASAWDGRRKRAHGAGEEAVINFNDGWIAIYHPSDPSKGVPFSRRGTLELHLPPGADPADIPAHLARLNLHGHAASRAEAECAYVARAAWAMRADQRPEWRQAVEAARAIVEERAAAILWEAPAPESDAAAERLAAEALVRAERETAPERARVLRRGLEAALGLPEGGLEKLPNWRPEPVFDPAPGGGGHWRWLRPDVDPAELREKAKAAGLVIGHELTGATDRVERLKAILESGVLAAQERRAVMGADAGHTMSPEEDLRTGGAAFTFLRALRATDEADIEWDPETILMRSDWEFRNMDTFGAVNPQSSHMPSESARVRDPMEVVRLAKAGKLKGNNELLVKDGIGLFGPFAPRRIRAGSEAGRDELLAWCKERGITHIGSRPVEEVIIE